MADTLPRYDPTRDYDWNYAHAPDPVDVGVPPVPGRWKFLGLEVRSHIGIPAGPLLNGRWVLYYARLGFDVLTYKTVRSRRHPCYPLPNLVPVKTGPLEGTEDELPATASMEGSWAVSFGMPSAEPDVWRRDVEQTREKLEPGQLLVVSVVATVQPGWTIEEVADDYARCARWAVDSGAHAVEANFSCPNVDTCDGQLYTDPSSAGIVARRIRDAVGTTPLILKIGHVTQDSLADALLDQFGSVVDGLAMTNSVATRVRQADASRLFDGARRGICGEATRRASLEQTRSFARRIAERQLSIRLIGVGGISRASHVRDYLEAGAETVQIATAAMVDPLVAVRIRREWTERA